MNEDKKEASAETAEAYPRLVKAIKANPPPWDVPLDQTAAPIHYEMDLDSV